MIEIEFPIRENGDIVFALYREFIFDPDEIKNSVFYDETGVRIISEYAPDH